MRNRMVPSLEETMERFVENTFRAESSQSFPEHVRQAAMMQGLRVAIRSGTVSNYEQDLTEEQLRTAQELSQLFRKEQSWRPAHSPSST